MLHTAQDCCSDEMGMSYSCAGTVNDNFMSRADHAANYLGHSRTHRLTIHIVSQVQWWTSGLVVGSRKRARKVEQGERRHTIRQRQCDGQGGGAMVPKLQNPQ